MAKKRTISIKDMQAEAAAVEAAPKKKAAKKKATKKKATRKTATRSRAKKDTLARRKKIWVVYSGTMKEEGRFEFHDRKSAEEKLEALRARATKKMYFIQPAKEPIVDEPEPEEEEAAEAEVVEKAAKK